LEVNFHNLGIWGTSLHHRIPPKWSLVKARVSSLAGLVFEKMTPNTKYFEKKHFKIFIVHDI